MPQDSTDFSAQENPIKNKKIEMIHHGVWQFPVQHRHIIRQDTVDIGWCIYTYLSEKEIVYDHLAGAVASFSC